MGRPKKPAGPNANLEPLGPRHNGSAHKPSSMKLEENIEKRPRSRSPSRTNHTSHRVHHRTRSPRVFGHHHWRSRSPKSSRHARHRSRSPQSSRRSRRSPRSLSPVKVSSSRSYRSRSPHHRDRVAPHDRGVPNSRYYRQSYAIRGASRPSESKGQIHSPVSTYNLGDPLDDEETPVTESWAELASRKHRELGVPAPNPPSPIGESWVEIASRKRTELMAIAAAKATTSIQIPLTISSKKSHSFSQLTSFEQLTPAVKAHPVSPVKYVRSSLSERNRLRQAEGLDIQRQVSSLIYPRKTKARPIFPAKPKVGITMEVRKEDIVLVESSAQPPGPFSATMPASVQEIHLQNEVPMFAPNQGMHPSRQSLLNSSPMPKKSKEINLYIQAESNLDVSPPRIRINTETLQSKIQELRRTSSASEKPRPIPSIMDDESFVNAPFESGPYANNTIGGADDRTSGPNALAGLNTPARQS
ncbi:hypothetical protein NHQ30_007195 [Ciborinia camelliae]|nr:hypothetical protein NHQ30_007195 [Ciborinia camelliae]